MRQENQKALELWLINVGCTVNDEWVVVRIQSNDYNTIHMQIVMMFEQN